MTTLEYILEGLGFAFLLYIIFDYFEKKIK